MNRGSRTSSRWQRYRERHMKKYLEARNRGAVDPPITPILDKINENPAYVTTSSCSGRIVLLATGPEEKKGESFFHRKWHRPVGIDEVLEGIESFKGGLLWFKMDPFIIHAGAESVEAAMKLVSIAKRAGVKIAGIQAMDDEKVHVEIRGIDSMAVPVYRGKPLVSRDYVKVLVKIANGKMVRNAARLERLFKAVSTEL